MRFSTRSRDGTRSETAKVLIKPFGVRGNVWRYTTGSRVTAGKVTPSTTRPSCPRGWPVT